MVFGIATSLSKLRSFFQSPHSPLTLFSSSLVHFVFLERSLPLPPPLSCELRSLDLDGSFHDAAIGETQGKPRPLPTRTRFSRSDQTCIEFHLFVDESCNPSSRPFHLQPHSHPLRSESSFPPCCFLSIPPRRAFVSSSDAFFRLGAKR